MKYLSARLLKAFSAPLFLIRMARVRVISLNYCTPVKLIKFFQQVLVMADIVIDTKEQADWFMKSLKEA